MANGFLVAPSQGGAPSFGRYGQTDPLTRDFQLIANVLAIPELNERRRQQANMERALLGGLGIPQQQTQALIPQAGFQPPGGIAGKVLSGVGQVGSVLSTLLGAPIAAPRLDVGTILGVEQLARGREKRQAQERAGELAARFAQDPTHEETKAAFVQELFKAGLGGTAVSMLKPTKPTISLDAALAREAERKTGSPVGTPSADAELIKSHKQFAAGIQAAKDQAALNIKVDPANVIAKAQADYTGRYITTRATEAGKAAEAMGKIAEVLPLVKEAVEKDFWAGQWIERVQQYGSFNFALSAPDWAPAIGVPIDQAMVTRLQAVANLISFAGLFLRAPGIDVGRLSDRDIERVAQALVRFGDAKMVAKAKLQIWDNLLRKANAGIPGSEIEALAHRILDLDQDAILDLPGLPPIGAGKEKLDLEGPIAGKITGQGRAALPAPASPAPEIPREQQIEQLLDLLENR